MTAITESPVFVLFNTAARNAASKDLPITLYESGVFALCSECCTCSALVLTHVRDRQSYTSSRTLPC